MVYLREVFAEINEPDDDCLEAHHISQENLPLEFDFCLHVLFFFWI